MERKPSTARLRFANGNHLRRWLTRGPGKRLLNDLTHERVAEALEGRELVVVVIDHDAPKPMVTAYGTRGVKVVIRNKLATDDPEGATAAEEWLEESLPRAFRVRRVLSTRQKAEQLVERSEPIDEAVRLVRTAVLKGIQDGSLLPKAEGMQKCNTQKRT